MAARGLCSHLSVTRVPWLLRRLGSAINIPLSCFSELAGTAKQPEVEPKKLEVSPHEMNFQKATHILLAPADNAKKFGWDFHLWQFFISCLPPAGVFLLAHYARYDMKISEEKYKEYLHSSEEPKLGPDEGDPEDASAPSGDSVSKGGSYPSVSANEDVTMVQRGEEVAKEGEVNDVRLEIVMAKIEGLEKEVRRLEGVLGEPRSTRGVSGPPVEPMGEIPQHLPDKTSPGGARSMAKERGEVENENGNSTRRTPG